MTITRVIGTFISIVVGYVLMIYGGAKAVSGATALFVTNAESPSGRKNLKQALIYICIGLSLALFGALLIP